MDLEELSLPRMTYDSEADAAYVTLTDHINAGEVHHTVPVQAAGIDETVLIDLGSDGRILGIEVLAAAKMLNLDRLR